MINMPPAVPTLNKMGYDSQVLDQHYTQAFINHLETLSSPMALEIGAGYGTATSAALKTGAYVTANDLNRDHLNFIKEKTDPRLQSKLTLQVGRFPQDLNFPSHTFDAILMSQVLHFLTATEIESGLSLLLSWLKPQGKLFLTAISPYIGVLQAFLPIYETRKQSKMRWPGQIENLQEYCDHPCRDLNPNFIHVFDPDILKENFTQSGFRIEKTDFYPIRQNADSEFKTNGCECVGIIASKR